jgi:hypothetical protein
MTDPLPPVPPLDWKRIVVFGVVIAGLGYAAATLAIPSWRGKAPIVQTLIRRSGQLCLVLEGEDREACAEIASVASALSRPKPAPGTAQSSVAFGSGGAQP